MADVVITCPFCGYRNTNQYQVQFHIEEKHTDDSPFVPDDHTWSGGSSSMTVAATASRGPSKVSGGSSPAITPEATWTRCTRPNCGEYVLLSDVDEHLDLHSATAAAEPDDRKPPPLPPRKRSRSFTRGSMTNGLPKSVSGPSPRKLENRTSNSKADNGVGKNLVRWLAGASYHGSSTTSTASTASIASTVRCIREPENPGRLGKRELGSYAFEQRMPDEVRRHLIHASRPQYVQRIGRDSRLIRETFVPNETPGLIPVLADLFSLDEDASNTYLCHSSVRHIRKLNCDGNFCGYWNIQVLLTFIQHMNPRGPQELPNVPAIQSLIEQAWDDGVCVYSRIQTGGIKNTRKWIGTQEVMAFFNRIDVRVEALSVVNGEVGSEKYAVEDLLDYVEAYFVSGTDSAQVQGTSFTTQLAPIYFQRFGHSMTIVGLEKRKDGSRNLLVFDSSFPTSEAMRRLLLGKRAATSIFNLLRPYRRSDMSLTRWDEFELIIPQIEPV